MNRKLFVAAWLVMISCIARAEDLSLEPTQNPDAPFRLFRTQNIHMLLKLDTRTGKIWQVQWGDKEHRFTDPLSLIERAPGGRPGRFTLCPTNNIYTFVLLDQQTGDAWHVQWGEAEERFVLSID